MSVLTPNMNLIQSTINVDSGLEWEQNLNASETIIDRHNHSPGSGVQITPDGLNLDADLDFLSNNAIDLRSVRFNPQVSPLAGDADLGCLYESGVDLYFNDANGNQIRITQGGGIAGTSGSIANLTPPASVSYDVGVPSFVFQSDVNVAASLDGASLILRNFTVSSNSITIEAPTPLPSSYAVILPQSLPSTLAAWSSDASGNTYWVNDYDAVVGSTAQVTSGMATHNSIGSALTAVGVDGIVKVLRGTFVENVTISQRQRLIGMGVDTQVTGNLSIVAVDKAYVVGMNFSGNMTLDSATTESMIIESYVASNSVITDNGSGNYIQLTQG